MYVDNAFQRKTNDLLQPQVAAGTIQAAAKLVEINAHTVDLIKKQDSGDAKKVINLVKSIQKTAEDEGDDPFLTAMARWEQELRMVAGQAVEQRSLQRYPTK